MSAASIKLNKLKKSLLLESYLNQQPTIEESGMKNRVFPSARDSEKATFGAPLRTPTASSSLFLRFFQIMSYLNFINVFFVSYAEL
jgi:hypothetical protein